MTAAPPPEAGLWATIAARGDGPGPVTVLLDDGTRRDLPAGVFAELRHPAAGQRVLLGLAGDEVVSARIAAAPMVVQRR
ncbi:MULTISPECIES: hypothetical protein [unclassified Luteococcus]|uniref:hypothetical protein n=1 Tax=unclassified Luteococcus TaxID=2639923 RepID=UPI00313D314D